jgi:hypothetical protein
VISPIKSWQSDAKLSVDALSEVERMLEATMHGNTIPLKPREEAAMCFGEAVLCFVLGMTGVGLRLLRIDNHLMETFFVLSGFFALKGTFGLLVAWQRARKQHVALDFDSARQATTQGEQASLNSAA